MDGRVDDQVILNGLGMMLRAVLASFGLAFLPEGALQPYANSGRFVTVFED